MGRKRGLICTEAGPEASRSHIAAAARRMGPQSGARKRTLSTPITKPANHEERGGHHGRRRRDRRTACRRASAHELVPVAAPRARASPASALRRCAILGAVSLGSYARGFLSPVGEITHVAAPALP